MQLDQRFPSSFLNIPSLMAPNNSLFSFFFQERRMHQVVYIYPQTLRDIFQVPLKIISHPFEMSSILIYREKEEIKEKQSQILPTCFIYISFFLFSLSFPLLFFLLKPIHCQYFLLLQELWTITLSYLILSSISSFLFAPSQNHLT